MRKPGMSREAWIYHEGKRAVREVREQRVLREGDEPLCLRSDLEAVEAKCERLCALISQHRAEIEAAGDVTVLFGRNRARRKHRADHRLWAALTDEQKRGS